MSAQKGLVCTFSYSTKKQKLDNLLNLWVNTFLPTITKCVTQNKGYITTCSGLDGMLTDQLNITLINYFYIVLYIKNKSWSQNVQMSCILETVTF